MNQNIKIAVDAIVFGYHEKELKVLLIKQKYGHYKNCWALVGGFVKDEETLTEAVIRELEEETGVKISYLEQLYTFGDNIIRDPRYRVVTVAYFALVNSSRFDLKADTDAIDVKWCNVDELPELAYDHNEIFNFALKRLKSKLSYQPIGFNLLEKEFLFSELENLYCTILQKNIDRRNFRKKILKFGILQETKKVSENRHGRPAKYFKFNDKKYNQLLKEGFIFEIN
ncbi:NUDIX domain-containing protein [Flavobacterium filum]|uniref:NUDIX hydrolase n=1 Tax=Flavobacterium filum TaxID=370974 RepID=UPI0023F4FF35|nr:NUDIX domain-containing protein [Flavobacterium filum]